MRATAPGASSSSTVRPSTPKVPLKRALGAATACAAGSSSRRQAALGKVCSGGAPPPSGAGGGGGGGPPAVVVAQVPAQGAGRALHGAVAHDRAVRGEEGHAGA